MRWAAVIALVMVAVYHADRVLELHNALGSGNHVVHHVIGGLRLVALGPALLLERGQFALQEHLADATKDVHGRISKMLLSAVTVLLGQKPSPRIVQVVRIWYLPGCIGSWQPGKVHHESVSGLGNTESVRYAWTLAQPAVTALNVGPRSAEGFDPVIQAIDAPLSPVEANAISTLFERYPALPPTTSDRLTLESL